MNRLLQRNPCRYYGKSDLSCALTGQYIQYQTHEISLAKAAAMAGVSFDRMKAILRQRGIQPRLGPETADEVRQELDVIAQALTRHD